MTRFSRMMLILVGSVIVFTWFYENARHITPIDELKKGYTASVQEPQKRVKPQEEPQPGLGSFFLFRRWDSE